MSLILASVCHMLLTGVSVRMEGSPNWEGTGDGAHNPVTCPPYIRYLCEAGAGEFQADDELKALISSRGRGFGRT